MSDEVALPPTTSSSSVIPTEPNTAYATQQMNNMAVNDEVILPPTTSSSSVIST